MFVRGGVLVRMVVKGVRGERVRLGPQIVGRAGTSAGEGYGMEASWDGQGWTQNARHELVSRVAVDGCAGAGVTFVLPPTVLFLRAVLLRGR